MGTYLSTPVVEKSEESGDALSCPAAPLVWGVVDMQGWRKSMEDSHVAQTNVAVPKHLQTDEDHDAKVFGVFDGHGGPEVARFVQLYLVDVLTQQPTWQKEPESSSQEQSVTTSPVGQALVDTFHALDRMIGHHGRRDELIRLRTEKPEPGEQRTALFIPPSMSEHNPVDVVTIGNESSVFHSAAVPAKEEPTASNSSIEMNNLSSDETRDCVQEENKTSFVVEDAERNDAKRGQDDINESNGPIGETETKNEPDVNGATTPAAAKEPSTGSETTVNHSADTVTRSETATDKNEAKTDNEETPNPLSSHQDPQPVDTDTSIVFTQEEAGVTNKDDDSNDAVGKEDAAMLDQDLMLDDSGADPEENPGAPNRKVTIMFQKLLSLGANTGQMSLRIVDKDTAEKSETEKSPAAPEPVSTPAPKAIVPTLIQNGRQICNLPDHPVHAGCTAIVTVLIGRKLTVANAGDSRAVLCRAGGRMEPLSFDHKPQQEREMNRIRSAGGFVNQFGRVNGNLNLSRSIGDLKYKQVPGIDPAKQMITAEPDIVEVYLQSNDEFLILGCDGIWDCLTNTQCVKYVRERIDIMPPTEIGKLMLDEIISDDPRATQGIGGDNMTVMIIDFQPGKRSYRKKSEHSDATH